MKLIPIYNIFYKIHCQTSELLVYSHLAYNYIESWDYLIHQIKFTMNVKEVFNEREGKMLDLFILNTSVFINALKVRKPMAMNPVEDCEADFSLMLLFQEAIDNDLGEEFATDLKKKILMYFQMAELEEPEINVEPIDLTK